MPIYSPDRWQHHYWQTDSRYYIAEVTQDLFGQWLFLRRWGSRTTKRGNEQHLSTTSFEEALRLLQATTKRRSQRGYRPVTLPFTTQ